MTDQTPLTDAQLQVVADGSTIRADLARILLAARARDARARSLIRLLWDSRRLWQDFADADAEDAERYEVLAVLRGVDKAALRSRVVELEGHVRAWGGMHDVAARRADEAGEWARWFAAERAYWWSEATAVRLERDDARARITELEAERDQAVDYDGRLAYLGDMNRQLLDKLDESRAEAGVARGSALALQARVMELQTQVTARDKRIAELESEAVADRRAIEEARDERDAALTAPVGPDTSDGYHTFDELYRYRLLYNAALFNEWARLGLYDVHKSVRHSDGSVCFDGKWFVVYATLPTGQISNHYEIAEDWYKFQVPIRNTGAEWDGHTPAQVAERLVEFLGTDAGTRHAAESAPFGYIVAGDYCVNREHVEWTVEGDIMIDAAEARDALARARAAHREGAAPRLFELREVNTDAE